MIRADNLAFLNAHGKPPDVHERIGLDLAHVTAAPPFFSQTEQLLHGDMASNGRMVPGINAFRNHLEAQDISVIRTADDLAKLEDAADSLSVILGIQGSPSDADSAGIAKLHGAGLRVMGIGYESADHPFGAGFSDISKGLTDAGRRYLEALADNGMILDLSHSGHQTALDALEYAKDRLPGLPIFASHTGVLEASSDHNRNFPNEILQGIKERGGIVGIYALTFALHDQDNSLKPVLDHIAAAVSEIGTDAVAIGSDGIYQHYSEVERRAQFADMSRMLNPKLFSARYPTEPDELNTPLKMDVLAVALQERGYTQEQVAGIIGLNAIRFYRESLPLQ